MTLISTDEMKEYKCLTKTHKCKYLKIIKIKDIDNIYRTFHNCVSEEEICCGCCREMEEIFE